MIVRIDIYVDFTFQLRHVVTVDIQYEVVPGFVGESFVIDLEKLDLLKKNMAI